MNSPLLPTSAVYGSRRQLNRRIAGNFEHQQDYLSNVLPLDHRNCDSRFSAIENGRIVDAVYHCDSHPEQQGSLFVSISSDRRPFVEIFMTQLNNRKCNPSESR